MTLDRRERWHRTDWLEAVYSSQLRPLERLAAAVYADHARDRDCAWVTLDRLVERSGMSRDAANRARRGLVKARWLVAVGQTSRRKATNYRLAVPTLSSTSAVRLSSTADGSLSSTPPEPSSPPDVPEQYGRRTQPQVSPQLSIHRARDLAGNDDDQPAPTDTVDGFGATDVRRHVAAALDAKHRRRSA